MKLRPRQPLPPFGEWSIEPAMADHLAMLVDKYKPDNVLELGSGLSTIVLAYAIENNGHGKLTSIENDMLHVERTTEWLAFHKLDHLARVLYAPIRNVRVAFDDGFYPWYSTDGLLSGQSFDFLFVDGPQGGLGTMARWPALFVLENKLSDDAIIVCDDAHRQHEAQMIDHWLKVFKNLKRENLPTKRGAAVLRRSNADTEGPRTCGPDPNQENPGR